MGRLMLLRNLSAKNHIQTITPTTLPIQKVITRSDNNQLGREKTGLWFASEQSLSYLDGTQPGDFGFDPLGVYDPEGKGFAMSPSWLQYSELIHARWAMLGAAGCIAPEILGKFGFIPAE